jgi:hypothetical protein
VSPKSSRISSSEATKEQRTNSGSSSSSNKMVDYYQFAVWQHQKRHSAPHLCMTCWWQPLANIRIQANHKGTCCLQNNTCMREYTMLEPR